MNIYITQKRDKEICLFLSSSNHTEHRDGSLLDCGGFADVFCGSIYNSSVLERTKCSSCRTGLNSHTSTCWFSFHFANMLLLTLKTGANLKPLKQMYRNLFSATPSLRPSLPLSPSISVPAQNDSRGSVASINMQNVMWRTLELEPFWPRLNMPADGTRDMIQCFIS